MTDLERLVALEEIRTLPVRYAKAIEQRDVEAMVGLFASDARFGSYGTGPEGVRRLMRETMSDNLVAVILVTNHLVELDAPDAARGEVWALCAAQSGDEYVEQLLRYEDRYRREGGAWRFLHRRHRLWFGTRRTPSPFEQPAADWPRSQVGVGDVPLADERFREWWDARARGRRPEAPSD
ncbi:MAG: nuclear transport factor 2 family protein [Actinobacteria bacterium]|nr:nuclear transport factor 2 family protein [Actinomycetota bacterium]